MASKKSVRKVSTKKTSKKKAVPRKKTTTAKKSTAKPSSRSSGGKKKAKVAKTAAKKKTSSKTTGKKKKVAAKNTATKNTTARSNKKVVKTVPKAKKSVKPSQAVGTKKTRAAKTKNQSSGTKKPLTRTTTPSPSRPTGRKKPTELFLSPAERYNIGGLFACAIDRNLDPHYSRLRRALRHLNLSTQEQDNLVVLSEGLMIPKLFAENLAEPKVNKLLTDLVRFAIKDGSYEVHWRHEIQQIGFWLGVFPAQFLALEQQARR